MDNVQILADSLNPETGDRLTTFLLNKVPKFLLAEINTHRVFSRNAASSRAIPVRKVIEQVKTDPFIPLWTSNKPGMQGGDDLSNRQKISSTDVWLSARNEAIERAEQLIEMGVSKQNVNRLLEPWMHVPVLISGTDWDNFWKLRALSNAAQPEFKAIALQMYELYQENIPVNTSPGSWHVPFIMQGEIGKDKPLEHLLKVATARAARCSYKNHLGAIEPEKDYELHDRLLIDQHLSPFEHSAKAMPYGKFRNFSGFISYRVHIEDGVAIL